MPLANKTVQLLTRCLVSRTNSVRQPIAVGATVVIMLHDDSLMNTRGNTRQRAEVGVREDRVRLAVNTIIGLPGNGF